MKRRLVIDIIRVIAILGVLSVHVTNRSLAVVNYDILRLPLIFLVEVASRFAVPLFFVVSGFALSMRYEAKFKLSSFYKKRVIKLLVPYCMWSGLYILYENVTHHTPMSLPASFDKLLTGGAAVQLYFIPSLLLLYLLFPLIKKSSHMITAKIILTYTFIESCLLLLDYFAGPIISFTPLRIALLNLYPFLIGMLTFMHEEKILAFVRPKLKFFFFAILLIIGAITLQTQYVYLRFKNVYFIDSQWQPLIFLYTILLWSYLLAALKNKLEKYKKSILLLSRLSFFVYFVHILYENLFWRIIGSYLLNKSGGHIVQTFWFTPLVFIFVAGSSYATAYIISFIPKLRTYLGIN